MCVESSSLCCPFLAVGASSLGIPAPPPTVECLCVSITLHNGASISHLIGTIAGPKDMPYEGATLVIDIHLPVNPSPSLPPPPLYFFGSYPSPPPPPCV
jgi:ubiquitin-protein ligase